MRDPRLYFLVLYGQFLLRLANLESKFCALMRVSTVRSYSFVFFFAQSRGASVVPVSCTKTTSTASGRHSQTITMKRAASITAVQSKAKKAREDEPAYHMTPTMRGNDGEIIWPAPQVDIENARKIIKKW